ncbi:hypothetical protein INR49_026629 [Caranx melampygus]|nr:hypothetical protein INR49_026629 [Caranx melampygus]
MSFNGSSSNNSISHPPESVPDPWYIVAGVIVVICLLGIPANIMVITKLGQHLRGSSISQRLFFSLAVSDLLCLVCLPFGMVIFYSGSHLPYSICQLLFYFFFFCVSSDLNILVLIGIQRYYQILHPQKWGRLARNWQRLLLSSVWMLAALEALPVVFSLTDMKTKKEWTGGHSCGDHSIAPAFEAVYIGFMILSHLALLTCYVLLVRGVSRAKMAEGKQPRATKLFIRIIAVSLAVAFFPFILRMLYVVALSTGNKDLLYISQMLTFVECFYFFNHCLNPFLYFFSSHYHKDSNKRNTFLSD